MTKEELLTKLVPNGTKLNIPQEVVYKCEITTEDLYDIFFNEFIEEYGDLQIWDGDELEEIFTEMWEQKKKQFYRASPPSEWGWEHEDIIRQWVKDYSK